MSRTGAMLETSFAADPIPATMRAAVYRGKGRVVVEDVPVPRIAAGEVLIRVAACGICGTDLKKIEHGFVAAPQILGMRFRHRRLPWARESRNGSLATGS